MKLLFSFLLVLATVSASAQKTINDPNVVSRTVSAFHAIEVGGGIDLYLSQGETALAVSAKDESIRNRIKTEVVNGVLIIGWNSKEMLKSGAWKGIGPIRVYVSSRQLRKLSARGGSDVNVVDGFETDSLTLSVSGGSDFKGKLVAKKLVINGSGGSDVNVSGTTDMLSVSVSGGSDLSGYSLSAERCSARASGGSDVDITVTKELSVEASGGSDVNWKGGATLKSSKSSGSSSVSRKSS